MAGNTDERCLDPNVNCVITRISCDLLGISNIDLSAISLAEHIARESLKGTIRLARNWSTKGNLDVSSVDSLNYGIDQLMPVNGSSSLFLFPNGDIDVDREDAETYSLIPRDLKLLSYMLVVNGHPATSDFSLNIDDDENGLFERHCCVTEIGLRTKCAEVAPIPIQQSCLTLFQDAAKFAKCDQKVGLKPTASETLTLEQQIFMKEIITVCMGQDDKKRHEALHTLETDSGLQVLLPHLTQRVCKSISANISQRCLSLIIYAGRVLRSISHNKACDMTVTLHDVLPALLSCCVGRNICMKPETDNHWALRDFSAKTLVGIIREQVDRKDGGYTCRRLFNFAFKVLKNSASSLSMIYGTIYILQEFVEAEKVQWLLNEFSEVRNRCKTQIESNRHGSRNQDAAKLNHLILKCESILRNRMSSAYRV
ncbi:unnamed protein product [Caenorhabditis sp. 36 PRJEB53466]|nr:unnamed protein product [Caenorhabditis sp. 36 PRJEB53466]